jgi:hypothetical protein
MENTLCNKAAFFMHYPNIDYHYISTLGVMTGSLLDIGDIIHFYHWLEQDSYLELVDLVHISDDDATEISKMHYKICNSTPESGRDLINTFNYVGGSLPSNVVDYLRSKGYAYVFGDLTIDDQIDYGWIKLIN